ncbi:MAG TPA: LacI family DNA-binding transcriptional regulator [Euzebya sp.]|nr:LacI family DNA-binding transcriptional regulator [Euzebya sp.]
MEAAQQRDRSRPTMRDVGALAGVSFKTVSRVVNGEGNVSPDLAERVNAAISELGYQRDSRASQLRSAERGTKTIGFVQVDAQNPFFSSIFRGLEDVMYDAGYIVFSGSSDGRTDHQDALITEFISRRVDGLAVVPSGDHLDVLRSEVERGTPVVCIDLDPSGLSVDVVMTDHRNGARDAVRHLIGHGHRQIAFLGDRQDIFSASERLRGYEDAMGEAGLPVAPSLIVTGLSEPAAARRATARMLDRSNRPTALFTAQNMITLGAIKAVHEQGVQHRVAMVGFDDVVLGDVLDPGISVVPQDPFELGRIAGGRLLRRLLGEQFPPERTVLPTRVVARGSGEIPGPGSALEDAAFEDAASEGAS